MNVTHITKNKREYMPLLLLADETEESINLYLSRSDLFALYDDGALIGVCAVSDEGDCFELQNLAIDTPQQRKGYGAALVRHVFAHYAGRGKPMLVGTGDSPNTVPFYESCGFVFSHRIKDYMLTHYDFPIYEDGVQLRDKVYL